MSHASVIVALSPEDLEKVGSDVQKAVEFQMASFDENGVWGGEGTRWDWWVIGGRYAGKFLGEDVVQRSDLDEDKLVKFQRAEAKELWAKFEADPHSAEPFTRSYVYGIRDGETLEKMIERFEAKRVSAYAFLRNRRWCESGRLGMFAAVLKSECELKAEDKGEDFTGRCVYKHDDGSEIVSFGEAGEEETEDKWGRLFWPRFIRNLPPETTLVAVDYHV